METLHYTVLVVDDSPEDAEVLARYLKQSQIETFAYLHAETGSHALQICREQVVDCIVLDYLLPDLDGLEVVRELLANEATRNIPIILITGVGDEALAVQALRLGAQDYLVKDKINVDILCHAVSNAIQRAQIGRKLAAQAQSLRESEERYRALVEASAQIVWHTDPKGHSFSVTSGWYELTGQRTEQIQQMDWLNVVHPADQERVKATWDQAIAAQTSYEQAFRVIAQDGSIRTLFMRGVPLHHIDGRVREWVGTGIDITEREWHEMSRELLAATSRALTLLLDSREALDELANLIVPTLADWCIIDLIDADGVPTTITVCHYDSSSEPLIQEAHVYFRSASSSSALYTHILHNGRAMIMPNFLPNFQASLSDEPAYLELMSQYEPISSIAAPMAARGSTLGLLLIARTASSVPYTLRDLELAEELARRAALAVDNARLYTAAQQARDEAQAAVRQRDQFLSVAAHELRTPLAVLLGHTQLLERRLRRTREIDERDQRTFTMMGEQIRRLDTLIKEMLDVSRMDNDQLKIERLPLDLSALTSRVLTEIQPALTLHTVVGHGLERPQMIYGDELRLEQVIRNLLQNAVKYSPNGGTITTRVERHETMLSLSLSDEGIGIPADELPRLFQRFYRARNAIAHRADGTGIGLYVVKEVIARHNGWVEVTSVEGQGSTFTIYLPSAELVSPIVASTPQHEEEQE